MDAVGNLVLSPAIEALREMKGDAKGQADLRDSFKRQASIPNEVASFIAQLSSFYIATSSADGQAHLHCIRGASGVLKVCDEETLLFADPQSCGNSATARNLLENEKAFLFFMDHGNSRRIEIWGKAHVIDTGAAAVGPSEQIMFTVRGYYENFLDQKSRSN